MATYRIVNPSFWTDTKVVDDFSPEDKYFYLYLLTNPYINIIGCFEVSIRQIANDLGYDKISVEKIIQRFDEHYGLIKYDHQTKELLVKNWNKYNWSKSPKLDSAILYALDKVKNIEFKNFIAELYNQRESVTEKYPMDTVSIPYPYPMDTSVSVSVSVSDTVSVSDKEDYDKNLENIKNSENSKNEKLTQEQKEKMFSEFWKSYPKKASKGQAKKTFLKVIKSKEQFQQIRDDLKKRQHFEQWLVNDGKYIPHPSTYLNSEGWLDIYKTKEEIVKDLYYGIDEKYSI